jgi:IS5 family transposase
MRVLLGSRANCVRCLRGRADRPEPNDRGKPGSKYHLLVDHHGLPPHVLLSAANTHDSKLFEPLLETNPSVRGHAFTRPAPTKTGEAARRQRL